MTSAQAMKQLKELQLKRKQILEGEKDTCHFLAATTESVEDVRPAYNFQFTQLDLLVVERNIRELKHRISVFNTTYLVPELGMTIDQVLVALPMLNERVNTLRRMAGMQEKRRAVAYGSRSNLIEYEYINFDKDQVREEYDKLSKDLAEMQIALDKANTTVDII